MTPERRRIELIAHRGASHALPENTLAAFDEARRLGADAIELDVQLTRDGVPVLYHDRTLHRLTGRRRRVAALTFEELAAVDAGAWRGVRYRGLRIPSLPEVLSRYAALRQLIEIKLSGGPHEIDRLVRTVVQTISAQRATGRVAVLCFDRAVLRQVSRLAPRLPVVLNARRIALGARGWRAELSGLAALSVDVRGLTPALGAAADDAGIPLLTYTCNGERELERALAGGVVGIMSDRPDWLAESLRARGLR